MIAASIAVIAPGVLLYLFASCCRSVLASCSVMELSEQAREVTGIDRRAAPGDEFERLFTLAQLCPFRLGDQGCLRAVAVYYAMLSLLGTLFGLLLPSAADRVERERGRCSYFAAVTLDRRITYSRMLWAEQMIDRRA